MEASDMLDVIHTLYEDEALPRVEDEAKNRSNMRTAMWRHLYNKDYPFPYTESASQGGMSAGGLPPDESLLPAETTGPKPVKPYIPPTDPEKLPQILDAPLR